ncbi:hypothetical protein L7F22_069055 [Adiantum nelumboides]|nr:hypothetical protein [Adiantum nelumboides]
MPVQTVSGDFEACREFFRELYTLNYVLGTYKKLQVSVTDGLAVGGACALTSFSHFQLASENAVFCSPETRIGFHPDAGSSFLLSCLKGSFGEYLALTGEKLDMTDMIMTRLVQNPVQSKRLPEILHQLHSLDTDDEEVVKNIIEAFEDGIEVDPDSFLHREEIINRIFSLEKVEDIIYALMAQNPRMQEYLQAPKQAPMEEWQLAKAMSMCSKEHVVFGHEAVNGQGSSELVVRQAIPSPTSYPGYFGGGSVFQAMVGPSTGLEGYIAGNVFRAMQPGMVNPMYGNIGVQPDFQGAYGNLGMLGIHFGMAAQNVNNTRKTGDVSARMATHEVPRLKAHVDDNVAPSSQPKEYKEGGAAVKFDTFNDTMDKMKVMTFIQQFDVAYEAEAEGRDYAWYRDVLDNIRAASPLSQKLALKSIRMAREESLAESLQREYRMSCRVVAGNISKDFYEGVRAHLIDKDHNPKWSPDYLESVSDEMVDAYFQPFSNKTEELELPLMKREGISQAADSNLSLQAAPQTAGEGQIEGLSGQDADVLNWAMNVSATTKER